MQRPKRSTRGQNTEKNNPLEDKDKQAYASFFGAQALQEESEADQKQLERQRIRQNRKDQLKMNLEKYPYVRSYHYYFDLETINRLQDHPSYVTDTQNLLSWTYSQEQKTFKHSLLSELLNRKYFGLPLGTGGEKKQEDNSDLNQFFEKEENNYGLDRMIYTCRVILRQLNKLVQTKKIKQFKSIVKKQPELDTLSSRSSLQKKEKMLQKTIEEYLNKKKKKILQPERIQKVENIDKKEEKQEGSDPIKKVKLD